ncbi:hypothetical protein GCM10011514_49550 [Emticicia aquatilis]|uniref:Outer membrane protein beta-barrel domain-containing protein n=1 Tax=Emticicia aquatilis TaxID=1537369 RepID=A0A916Z7G7_9BACT|nr:hypothetical protein [Emticicia aquatilis]GGD79657.1 hypothetical protein GCM10011514_49550 [Emticicia aquatilis]
MNRARNKCQTIIVILILFIGNCSLAQQDSTKIFFTSSVGLLVPASAFAKSYQQSLALNSGIEYGLKRNFFLQFVLDFNAVKYSQQIKDKNSNYLFQNTNSSVLLAGFNFGKNIAIVSSKKCSFSPYLGIGYANIGEPRLTVDVTKGIISQTVTRMQGIYSKAGTRILYNTNSKLLQTLYLDSSYWLSNVRVQESTAQAWSFLIGTRIGF